MKLFLNLMFAVLTAFFLFLLPACGGQESSPEESDSGSVDDETENATKSDIAEGNDDDPQNEGGNDDDSSTSAEGGADDEAMECLASMLSGRGCVTQNGGEHCDDNVAFYKNSDPGSWWQTQTEMREYYGCFPNTLFLPDYGCIDPKTFDGATCNHNPEAPGCADGATISSHVHADCSAFAPGKENCDCDENGCNPCSLCAQRLCEQVKEKAPSNPPADYPLMDKKVAPDTGKYQPCHDEGVNRPVIAIGSCINKNGAKTQYHWDESVYVAGTLDEQWCQILEEEDERCSDSCDNIMLKYMCKIQ